MSCQSATTTVTLSQGLDMIAALPKSGVLRLVRGGATDRPQIDTSNGKLRLRFKDGASVTLKTA